MPGFSFVMSLLLYLYNDHEDENAKVKRKRDIQRMFDV